jgi:hypothetical protein
VQPVEHAQVLEAGEAADQIGQRDQERADGGLDWERPGRQKLLAAGARLSHLGSLCLIFSVNVRHSPRVKIKLGPSGFLESRRAWPP